ncbi:MAG: TIGR03546 family protein [Oceanospirillaceae bacterium]|nr:TIGR03546 family protein [Oceanospirillaceae bacterium]|tara:strand:+ start:2003 stop:2503 length:501 start_codon:yes stop_codon:yes gene_type:complete
MLSLLANLLKALNSESAPGQISLAIAFSAIVAFTPFLSLHNILILLIVLVVRTNLSGFLVGYVLFSMLAFFIDPLSIRLGESLLANPGLMDTWVALYQSEWWRMTAFNHTLTLGGFVIGVAAFAPVYLLSNVLIRQYRQRFMEWFMKLKVVQALQATKFYVIYQSL